MSDPLRIRYIWSEQPQCGRRVRDGFLPCHWRKPCASALRQKFRRTWYKKYFTIIFKNIQIHYYEINKYYKLRISHENQFHCKRKFMAVIMFKYILFMVFLKIFSFRFSDLQYHFKQWPNSVVNGHGHHGNFHVIKILEHPDLSAWVLFKNVR